MLVSTDLWRNFASMSYRLDHWTRLPDDIIRVAKEQLQTAITETTATKVLREQVHSVRTCLKKTRSLLQLIRPSVPDEFYETEDRRLREAGRQLAPLRDAFVQLSSFKSVELPTDNPAVQCAYELLTRQDAEHFRKVAADLASIRLVLEEILKNVDRWPVAQIETRDICVGTGRIYKSARKAWAKAKKDTDAETLHRWRGKTKVLAHSLRLIADCRSKPVKKQFECAKKLGEVLGAYHDLSVLMDTIDKLPDSLKGRNSLNKTLSKQCCRLQKRAFKLGEIIYKTKPAAWTRKVARVLPSK